MPELPEVETIRRTLAPRVVGQAVLEATVYDDKTLALPSPPEFTRRMAGTRLVSLERRGKYLLFGLAPEGVLVAHLGMSGQLLWQPGFCGPDRHTRAVWKLERGYLVFRDPRRFGRLWLLSDGETARIGGLAGLGPEPLPDMPDPEALFAPVAGRRRPLKALLLDQRFLAGIGNIYADEILFRAGLDPRRPVSSLSPEERQRLLAAIPEVLREALEHGGTSVRDYVDGQGREGEHQAFLRVYGRAGLPCTVCGESILRVRIAGRGTHFCPRCQT
ncbi:MAG: DNA-formamidopyrimidine glycosylase [Clostridia bacterium]|nr:DNA-formamidopyrimidine glycosylase [Clostridia bacterium]MDH7573915.1 DNA-formamidopyrimidine glycosylase [Clostridia bacterium]